MKASKSQLIAVPDTVKLVAALGLTDSLDGRQVTPGADVVDENALGCGLLKDGCRFGGGKVSRLTDNKVTGALEADLRKINGGMSQVTGEDDGLALSL